MWYRIDRQGKSGSYPYESCEHYISKDGEHWEQVRYYAMPRELINEAFSYRLHKYECKTWILEVKEKQNENKN